MMFPCLTRNRPLAVPAHYPLSPDGKEFIDSAMVFQYCCRSLRNTIRLAAISLSLSNAWISFKFCKFSIISLFSNYALQYVLNGVCKVEHERANIPQMPDPRRQIRLIMRRICVSDTPFARISSALQGGWLKIFERNLSWLSLLHEVAETK